MVAAAVLSEKLLLLVARPRHQFMCENEAGLSKQPKDLCQGVMWLS
jgi:hypothetical protein